MSEIALRTAIAADVDEIKQCAVEAYTKYIERIGKSPAPMLADFTTLVSEGRVVVATRKARVCGYVVFFQVNDLMHLENVAVYPRFSGNGIGKTLIRHVERVAVSLGLTSVMLYTNEAMTENLAMYPALGYEEYERRREEGFNRVYYRKPV